jgi:hypothetical protein
MIRDPETLNMLLDSVRRFVREDVLKLYRLENLAK